MNEDKNTKERKITLIERQRIINDRYNRQKLLGGWWDQDKLLKGHVFVVGAGALGNEIVKNLVMFGVGEISIV
ncbi:MAG: ThiF family adenylyltransferase, partial [Thermoplasmata archaeon]